jgi:trans-aconitate methyltransferase
MYDYALGGKENSLADRRAVENIRAVVPELTQAAWANRGFHQRAAIWMASQGIGQFADLGCGLPTAESTHQAVHKVMPSARVAYVDHDPQVVRSTRALLASEGKTSVILADVRDPGEVLAALHLDRLIEFAEPVGLLCTAVLDHVAAEDDPWGCMSRLVSALAPGSYLAISHLTGDQIPPLAMTVITAASQEAGEPVHPRSKPELEKFFRGLDLVPPYENALAELCRIGVWGAEDPDAAADDSSQWWWAGLARRPTTARSAPSDLRTSRPTRERRRQMNRSETSEQHRERSAAAEMPWAGPGAAQLPSFAGPGQ